MVRFILGLEGTPWHREVAPRNVVPGGAAAPVRHAEPSDRSVSSALAESLPVSAR